MRLRPTSPIFSPLRGKKMKNCTSHIGKFEKIQIKIFAYYIYSKTILKYNRDNGKELSNY